jgi:4-aminobutyrate aminotransferase-like enzyme
MPSVIHHPHEMESDRQRDVIADVEPRSLRTLTPTQAVLARSAGVFHWTPEGRRLYDFSSGVLVANLGHNPVAWTQRFLEHLGWKDDLLGRRQQMGDFFTAVTLTAYNAITPIESLATRRLTDLLQSRPGGRRLQQVMWAASGSEAIQKALWTVLARERGRDIILATRHGFHGKKGLAGAVTGSETDKDRDPRVRFFSFPMAECMDVSMRGHPADLAPYRQELDALQQEFGKRLCCLITEPYLGGGGSFHPPREYLQLLQQFCRQHDLVFVLDEVQSNFGRTGELFAFETYGIEPDVVVLGKGLGNGVPVSAAVGPADLFAKLDYGEGSDTWSANPLSCAAVLATLEEYASTDIMQRSREVSAVLERGLVRLKQLPMVSHVRGERGGMVWGVEMRDHAGRPAAEWAQQAVLAAYRGLADGQTGDGVHLLGPLAKKVIRIAPPLALTPQQASEAAELLYACWERLVGHPR